MKEEDFLKKKFKKMVEDAEKFKAQDEEVRKKVEAKNALEWYCFGVRNSLSNEQFATAIYQENKDKINQEINDTLAWIDGHHEAESAEFEAKQKELDGKLMPIMQNAYQNASSNNNGPNQSNDNQSRNQNSDLELKKLFNID